MNKDDGHLERTSSMSVRAPAELERSVSGSVSGRAPEDLSTKDLFGRIVSEATALARKEVELARAELMEDVKAEAKVATALGVGAVLGLCGLTLALVTVVLALSLVLPGWAAGLIVTGVVLAAAAIVALIGWRKRVRNPLERTRRHLQEDVRWMKERIA
jgi:uncharacterized membrane protein YqjE